MKVLKITMLSMLAVGLLFSGALAAEVATGKALFNNPELGGGRSGKSCNSCHPGGRGVEKAGEKKSFNIMGQKQNGLEAAVNFCIEMALKGKPIDAKSTDMADIMAYIRSLKGTTP